MTKGIIYLIQPTVLVGSFKFKVGCSGKSNLDRIKSYDKNSRYLCIHECTKPYELEKQIKAAFNDKFTLVSGQEYFEGDEFEMIKTFIEIFTAYINQNYNNNKPTSKVISNPVNNNVVDDVTNDAVNNNIVNNEADDNAINDVVNDNAVNGAQINTNNKNKFVCKPCNKEYKTQSGLWKHNDTFHKKPQTKITNGFECRKCHKQFNSQPTRWRHEEKCFEETADEKIVKLESEINKLKTQLTKISDKPNVIKKVEDIDIKLNINGKEYLVEKNNMFTHKLDGPKSNINKFESHDKEIEV